MSKMTLTGLITSGNLKETKQMLYSLGITIDSDQIHIVDILTTFLGDTVILFATPIIIQTSRHPSENQEEIGNHYYRLIAVAVIFSVLSCCFVPSVISAVMLLANLTILFLWSFKQIGKYKTPIGYLFNLIFYIAMFTYLGSYLFGIPLICGRI